MTKKILIIGNTGFLGAYLSKSMGGDGFEVHSIGRETLDFTQPLKDDLQELIEFKKFTHALICFAVSDVQKCFLDQVESEKVNVLGTVDLLRVLKKNDVIPVFFSSDYVFKPSTTLLRETDEKDPQTVYGKQKLSVETYLKNNFQKYLLFRTSKLMSKTAHPKNILYEITENIRLNKPMSCFQDQWITPVFIEDIAKVLKLIISNRLTGKFHLGTRKIYSRLELANLVTQALGKGQHLIKEIKMSDMNFSEPRPNHNILDCKKIEEALGFEFQEIQPFLQNSNFLQFH